MFRPNNFIHNFNYNPPGPKKGENGRRGKRAIIVRFRSEATRDEATLDEATLDEATRDEATRDEATLDEATRDEATRDEATRDDIFRARAQLKRHNSIDKDKAIFINEDVAAKRAYKTRLLKRGKTIAD